MVVNDLAIAEQCDVVYVLEKKDGVGVIKDHGPFSSVLSRGNIIQTIKPPPQAAAAAAPTHANPPHAQNATSPIQTHPHPSTTQQPLINSTECIPPPPPKIPSRYADVKQAV